ncbi:hypothetical protein FIBSPDRAFT_886588 [Athelia psychrophila]|uniref:Uncharacterized protein n=1 Tax=Athelia psychrophila TaxID=1759441 RepID=A0A166QMW8_9AGAM|nr:hypothetical protein FIBSPDRAFT_886588 [Fibularhizoctonia sp. CBS 109695]
MAAGPSHASRGGRVDGAEAAVGVNEAAAERPKGAVAQSSVREDGSIGAVGAADVLPRRCTWLALTSRGLLFGCGAVGTPPRKREPGTFNPGGPGGRSRVVWETYGYNTRGPVNSERIENHKIDRRRDDEGRRLSSPPAAAAAAGGEDGFLIEHRWIESVVEKIQ